MSQARVLCELFVSARAGKEATSSALNLHHTAHMNNLSWFRNETQHKRYSGTIASRYVHSNYDDEIMSELWDQRTTKHFFHLTLGELEYLNWSPHSRICYPIFPPREYISWKPIDTCLGHP